MYTHWVIGRLENLYVIYILGSNTTTTTLQPYQRNSRRTMATMNWVKGPFVSAHASYIGIVGEFPSNCSSGRTNCHSFLMKSSIDTIEVPGNLWWYLSHCEYTKPGRLILRPSLSMAKMLSGEDAIMLTNKDAIIPTNHPPSTYREEGWVEEP